MYINGDIVFSYKEVIKVAAKICTHRCSVFVKLDIIIISFKEGLYRGPPVQQNGYNLPLYQPLKPWKLEI